MHSLCLQGLSIACSTPAAIAWDEEWAGMHEISGRVMKNVHEAGAHLKEHTDSGSPEAAVTKEDSQAQVRRAFK